MKKTGKLVVGILFLGALTLTSCKKEGCTDSAATNYSSSSKTDDGTCSYTATTTFWYGESTSLDLVADGATKLTVYVDYEKVGETDANIYWTGAPECGASGAITVTTTLIDPNETHVYSVEDQDGIEYWKGTIDLSANTCLNTELVY